MGRERQEEPRRGPRRDDRARQDPHGGNGQGQSQSQGQGNRYRPVSPRTYGGSQDWFVLGLVPLRRGPRSPAVEVSQSRADARRFSYCAGFLGEDGFRSTRHLHDNYLDDFLDLFQLAGDAVDAVRKQITEDGLTDGAREMLFSGSLELVRAEAEVEVKG